MTKPVYRASAVGGCLAASIEQRADGTQIVRSVEPLEPYPRRLTDRFEHWAAHAPDRTLAARRDGGSGDWVRVTYAQMLDRARRIGQALATRPLSAERPVVLLSGNDLEHLTLQIACQWIGVPFVPASPAYSLVSKDYGKLRHILATVTPGLIFASGAAHAPALAATAVDDVEAVLVEGDVPGRATTRFAELLATTPGPEVDAAHDRVGPDTIVKLLFTSGSTKNPKGVVNTQRMVCANLQMTVQSMAFLADQPPVLVDWLPWNHVFGGNQNVGITLYCGGTLYIDDGKPTPAGIAQTLRNLREISPTVYFNVPKGFEEIARAMDDDAVLRESLFRHVAAFMFAGAGLSQAVWDSLHRHAERTVGERIPMITGLGMTETAPSCLFALRTDAGAGHIGLPCPGVEVKIAPMGDPAHPSPWDKSEVRFRGPNVMPGYWREPALTADAFDDEGFYRTGDAVKWVDASAPERGLLFDGRIAEDFKLSTGTFVSVGPLRAKIIAEGHPCVQDGVVAGLNRDDIAVLIVPRLDDCRALAGLGAAAGAREVLDHPAVQAFFQALADCLWRSGTGSANRVARLHVLAEPPSLDKGEVTDKGSINQRAVLQQRAALVEAVYGGSDPFTVTPRRS